MSLYNLIHGVNPLAPALLAALGISHSDVPRFRDCYWNGKQICVYTRTGGGNREDYEAENDAMTRVVCYDRDEDDDFDRTYATFYYNPPDALREELQKLQAADATPAQKWDDFFARLNSGKDDPQVVRVVEAMAPMMEQIASALKEPK